MFLSNLQLYVGNLQVVRTEVWTILTSNRGVFLSNLQLYVGNLQVLRTQVLTVLTSNQTGVFFVKLAAVGWQPTGRKDGSLDSLDIKQCFFVKLAAVCWQPTGRKDGSLDNLDIKQGCFLSNLQRYVGNLQVLRTEVLTILTSNRGVFCQTCSCMLASPKGISLQGPCPWYSSLGGDADVSTLRTAGGTQFSKRFCLGG